LDIRRSLRRTGTKLSREKYFPANFHRVRNYDTPRMRARGDSWEERKAKTKVKVKYKVKVKVKAKVGRDVYPTHTDPPINLLFPKLEERFHGG
jgi:hypothetical protein